MKKQKIPAVELTLTEGYQRRYTEACLKILKQREQAERIKNDSIKEAKGA